MADVPLVAVTATGDVVAELRQEDIECPVVALRRIVKPPFENEPERRTTGPLFVVN
jgi:hypothetical protein